jgi:hypothetical protein
MAIVASAGAAKADVPNNGVGHVWLNLNNPGQGAQSQFSAFITSLRQAAGHDFRGGVYQTQTETSNRLIRADITDPAGNQVWLWITPSDLYVRGFTSQTNGTTYYFGDDGFNLQMLDFGSNYNSMSQAAGRGRDTMLISFNDLVGSVRNLATVGYPYGGNQQDVARSMMFMIQYTSEAARFWDVYGVMSDIMNSWTARYDGLPLLQQNLENSWDAISQYGYRVTNDPYTPPTNITGVGTFWNWGDVQARLGTMTPRWNGLSPSGDWWHTEL